MGVQVDLSINKVDGFVRCIQETKQPVVWKSFKDAWGDEKDGGIASGVEDDGAVEYLEVDAFFFDKLRLLGVSFGTRVLAAA